MLTIIVKTCIKLHRERREEKERGGKRNRKDDKRKGERADKREEKVQDMRGRKRLLTKR